MVIQSPAALVSSWPLPSSRELQPGSVPALILDARGPQGVGKPVWTLQATLVFFQVFTPRLLEKGMPLV